MTAFVRLEVWDNFEASGGTRQSVFTDLITLVETIEVMGTDRLVFTVPSDEPALAILAPRGVLRLVYDDGAEQIREWRLDTKATTRKGEQVVVTIECDPVLLELANEEIVFQETDAINRLLNFQLISMSVSDQLSQVLNAVNTSADFAWTAGTIDVDAVIDVVYDWDTPLSAVRKIAEAAQLEINVRKDGVTGYFIDFLTAIGASAAQVDLRASVNLPELNRREVSEEQATIVQPRGQLIGVENGRIDRNIWVAFDVNTSPAPDEVKLVRLNDLTTSPIEFDDQYNGHYLFYNEQVPGTGFVGPIIDTIKSTNVLEITDASAIAGFTAVSIVPGNTAREALSVLENPAGIVAQGKVRKVLDLPDIPGYHNYIKNADLSGDWNSGNPAFFWGINGATVTENSDTAFIKTSDRSAKVVCTNDGDGIGTNNFSFIKPEMGVTLLDLVSWFCTFYVDSSAGGRIRAYAILGTNGIGGSGIASWYTFPSGINDANKAFTEREKQWIDLGVAGNDPLQNQFLTKTDSLEWFHIELVQDGATPVTFYLDSMIMTKSAVHVPFVAENGSVQLMLEANKYLAAHETRDIEYTLRALDLDRIDASVWSDYEFVLGQTARVIDAELGISDTVRLVSLARNWLDAGATQIQLSTNIKTLSTRVAAALEPPVERRVTISDSESPDPATLIGGSGGGAGSTFGLDGWEATTVVQNISKSIATIIPRHTDDSYLTPHGTNVTKMVVRVPSNATLTVGTVTISVVKGENAGATADATVDTVLEIDISSANIAQAAADGGLEVSVLPSTFQLPSGHDLVVAYSTTATITESNLELRVSLEVSKVAVASSIAEGSGGSFRVEAGTNQLVSAGDETVISSSVADPSNINHVGGSNFSAGQSVQFLGHITSVPDLNDTEHVIVAIVNGSNFTIPVNVTTAGTGGTMRDFSGAALPSYEKIANAEVAFTLWFKRTGVNSNNINMVFGARSQRSIRLYYDKTRGHMTLDHEPTLGGQFGIYTLDMIANGGLDQWIGVGISWDRSDIANLPVIKVLDPLLSLTNFVTATATEVQAITQDFRTVPSDGWFIGSPNATQGFVGNINNLNVWIEADGIPTESQMLSALLVNAPGPASPVAHYPLDSDTFQSRLRSDVGPPFHDVRLDVSAEGTIYDTIGPPYA